MRLPKIPNVLRRTLQRAPRSAKATTRPHPLEPLEDRRHLAADPSAVRVMTQNLSYGAGTGVDLFAGAMTGDLWQNIQDSDFPARAAAIAHQVQQAQPDFIGLQEAVIWRTGKAFRSSAAKDVQYDFTKILVSALADRGMTYRPVATATNADIEFPGRVNSSFRDIRLTDQDVILARVKRGARATILNTDSGNYDATFNLDVPVLGDMPFTRGWAAVDARIGKTGRPFRFVTTHLDAFSPSVRDRQAEELLEGPASSLKVPVILSGDFNAPPGSTPFRAIADASFSDAWTHACGTAPGYTGTQSDTLDNRTSQLSARIDAIFFRGKRTTATAADLLGESPADKTPSGLWPSDHAGVTATISLNRHKR